MSHIQIRYNTKNNGGPLKWRVVVDGKEALASHIKVNGHVYGESSSVNGVEKMNIACDGKASWDGTTVQVTTTNPTEPSGFTASKKRSLVKSLTWRVLAIVVTFASIYLLTGEVDTATAGTVLTNSINFVLYYLHERVWLKVPWGKASNRVPI
jgi:uncharacterized membrane protein